MMNKQDGFRRRARVGSRLILLGWAALALCSAGAVRSAEFFVAPQGRDTNPGTQAQPFASLEAARDAARQAGQGEHRIVLLPGDFFRAKTFQLSPADNGLTLEAAEPGGATLYGGKLVAGWQREGENFWAADLPEVKAGQWDFRALVVNGRLAERARLPEQGTLTHLSKFDVKWLSSVAGGWERKPTDEELTTMRYDAKDLPPTLDVRNAEVRIYHMWDESLVGVARNDTAEHKLIFAPAPRSPAGAFGVKKYVVWNTREGMHHPGQWYLDRTAGRVVYWPLPGEDMTTAKVVAPVLEKIIELAGEPKASVERVTLRGVCLQATTTPLKAGGFGAYAFEGALSLVRAKDCAVENLEICNVGGQGLVARQVAGCRIVTNRIHHVGACAIKADGSETLIAQNHIHHAGVYHPSAIALSVTCSRIESGKGFRVQRNEVHDTPYSGIVGSGGGHLIEDNLIYRVMREMHDGGAIYGGMRQSILRGNLVRDVVKMGEGYGVSSYYLDEGARDCIVERNVSLGVERPTHNHIATDLIIRDNVFIAETNMTLSFQRSKGCVFEGNTLFVPGKISIAQPGAIRLWTNNLVFREGLDQKGAPQAFTINDAMPAAATPERRNATAAAPRLAKPPTVDGELGDDEWPGVFASLEREPSRWSASGAPAFFKCAYDDQNLYLAVNVSMFDVAKIRPGADWGKDDGLEFSIAGKTAEGKPVVFVVRGFAGGTKLSLTDAGAPADAAGRVGEAARYAAKPYGKGRGGWRGELSIPLASLGLQPKPGLKVPFNLAIFRAEDSVFRCWEGTLGESWKLDQAGTLHFK